MVWRSLWPKHNGSIQPATGFKPDYFFEDRYTARRISSIPLWLYCQVSSKNRSPFYSKNTKPGCRTATAVQRLWQTLYPPAGEKIIPVLKAHKVVQRTKVVLISQNYTLGLNGWRYEKLPIAGDFLSSYKKVEAGYNPSHTTGTLIGYIVCWQQFFIFFF